MKKFISRSEQETIAFADEFAQKLNSGTVLALSGDLGAGKTAFTKGVAKSLGVKNRITSPTFVFMKVYNTKHSEIKKLIHIDAYRLTSEKELESIGAAEYLGEPGTLTIVEWPENIKNFLPQSSQNLKLKYINENTREINY